MEEINIVEMLNYFKSKLVMIIFITILIIVLGNTYTLLTRVPKFQSSTSVILVSENGDQSSITVNRNLIGTYTEIIKSRKVINKVIDNLGLDYTFNDVSKNITVNSLDEAEIISIKVSMADATNAKIIADEIAEVFIGEVKDRYNLSNVSILDEAVEAKYPYNVNYVKDNIIYLLAGLVLSCGLVFVIYYFDTTVKSSEEIESKLGLSVLGVVPKEEME